MAAAAVVEGPQLKKAKPGTRPVVVYADELNFKDHAYLNPVYVNKQKGFKLVKVQCSSTNQNPLRIQFASGNGRIPQKFGVDTNTHGKTYLTFAIPCEAEYQALLAFQQCAKEYAKAHKNDWWTYPVSDSQIEDNFAAIVSVQKERDGGGHWPANMKVMIPLDEATGEPKDCHVMDEDGNTISIQDLPGRKWDKVLIEVSGIYFQNRFNWGFGPKTLRLVQLTENDNVEPSSIDYAALALRDRDEHTRDTAHRDAPHTNPDPNEALLTATSSDMLPPDQVSVETPPNNLTLDIVGMPTEDSPHQLTLDLAGTED